MPPRSATESLPVQASKCCRVGEDSRPRSEQSDLPLAAAFAPSHTLPIQQLSMPTMSMIASCVSPSQTGLLDLCPGGANVPVRVRSRTAAYAEFPVVL